MYSNNAIARSLREVASWDYQGITGISHASEKPIDAEVVIDIAEFTPEEDAQDSRSI